MTKQLFLLFAVCITFSTQGQEEYARKIIKKLSSPKIHGRGYVKNGEKKAAKYIAKEFKKHGLNKFNNSYYQKFEISVNTQPKNIKLNLNDTLQLIPGKEFLINPNSPSVKGIFSTIRITQNELLVDSIFQKKLKHSENKFILIDRYGFNTLSKSDKNKITNIINYLCYNPNPKHKGCVIFTDDKLTWTAGFFESSKASFTIQKKINIDEINKISVDCDSEYHENYQTQNVIGFLEGKSKSDSTIVISAHYDHLGRMGSKTLFPGANDNASGIALLLNLAAYFSEPSNRPDYNLLFIAFGAEEIGLLGSKYYIDNPLLPLEKIKFLLNFDLAGTGDEGIKVVNATVFTKEFELLQKINRENSLFKKIAPRGTACNSDHCFFYEKGIPCFYSYTLGGISAYHDIYDKYETLPLTKFTEYNKLIQLYIKQL